MALAGIPKECLMWKTNRSGGFGIDKSQRIKDSVSEYNHYIRNVSESMGIPAGPYYPKPETL